MLRPLLFVRFVPTALLALVLASALLTPTPHQAVAEGSASAPVSAVSAGLSHTCAVRADGVKCWGWNNFGQLGNSTTTDSVTPVGVTALGSGVNAVSAGSRHTCVLTAAGGVKCWGQNFDGQLGDNQACGFSCRTPVDVFGLSSGVIAVSAGFRHTCALTTAGGVKCWGYNGEGQLGNSTTTSSTTPVNVTGLTSNVSAVSTGGAHSCAMTLVGGAKCWGDNQYGQLGDSTTVDRTTPVDVTGLTLGIMGVNAGGGHTCALTEAGGVKCWGWNSSGQMGDGTTANFPEPVDVTSLTSGVSAVSTGYAHTCALTAMGGLKCWGGNSSGELGNNTLTSSSTPVNVTGLSSNVGGLSAGGSHTCALTEAGGVKCWGDNNFGQLGDSTATDRTTPVDVFGKGPVDTDDDDCPDYRELQIALGSELAGGRRSFKNAHDYFNPSGDGVNRVDDILLVVQAYFDDDSDGNPGLPPYEPGYDPATDRSNMAASPNAWNTGAPDGLQRVQDILHSVNSYFHDCS